MELNVMKVAHKVTRRIFKLGFVSDNQDYKTLFTFALRATWKERKYFDHTSLLKTIQKEHLNYTFRVDVILHDVLGINPALNDKFDLNDTSNLSKKYGIKDWVFSNNLRTDQRLAVGFFSDGNYEIAKKTDKALQIAFKTDVGDVFMWTPKSQLTN